MQEIYIKEDVIAHLKEIECMLPEDADKCYFSYLASEIENAFDYYISRLCEVSAKL